MANTRRCARSLAAALFAAVALSGCSAGGPLASDNVTERAPESSASSPEAAQCEPTIDDGLSPSYVADAPVRSVVGDGHVLSGLVVSSRDCRPIAEAKLELWPEYAGQGHPDRARATVYTDARGRYRFECDPPEHIHMRISAAGYVTIAQNSYHPDGRPEGEFDIALRPVTP